MLHRESLQIFQNMGKRKFILTHGHRLLMDAAQLASCTASPGPTSPGSRDDCLKLVGTPDNLLKARFKLQAAFDKLHLVQEPLQLNLDSLLPEPMKNRAGWSDFCTYIGNEIQASAFGSDAVSATDRLLPEPRKNMAGWNDFC